MASEDIKSITNNKIMVNYDNMTGEQFESFCKDLLLQNGFTNVTITKKSGDYGVDLLAEKDLITYAIQCKCWNENIGNKAVQEIYSGKTFYNRMIGVVLTNRYFTNSAIETAIKTNIILWDRTKLNEFIKNSNYELNSEMPINDINFQENVVTSTSEEPPKISKKEIFLIVKAILTWIVHFIAGVIVLIVGFCAIIAAPVNPKRRRRW